MLYPLVEACLPEDVLRTWERSLTVATGDGNTKANKLELLMKFLRSEVEGEERINMVRQGFGFESPRRKVAAKVFPRKDIPTAAGLLNDSRKQEKSKQIYKCIFCENQHWPQECKIAEKMPFEAKRNILVKRGCCFACLKTGHVARRCRNYVRCKTCSRKHWAIMCPESKLSSQYSPNLKEVNGKEDKKDHTLANKTCTQDVLLQTLTIRLRGQGDDQLARALIDTGSQRSYITKRAAIAMGYEPLGEEKINHSLFGGIETSHTHQQYRVLLSSIGGNYKCNFEVYDQDKICAKVPKIKHGQWTEELKSAGILLSDFETTFSTNEENSSDIHLLIGADVAGKLFTGNIRLLTCGLTAMETHLGWTLMGKIPQKGTKDSSLLVLSLHVTEAKIADLWSLDSLGILDPAEKRTKQDLQEQAAEHFRSTVKRDSEGRYEVSLPWIEGHSQLPSNLSLAERRLKSTIKDLQSKGNLEAYEDVFKNWIQERIIEKVPETEINNFGHYLPHRAVIRMNSTTTRIRPVFDASAKAISSPSLNDCLEKGPNLVEMIPAVINHFREGNIGVISDIRKAFLQIGLNVKDRDFLRFLWWERGNPDNRQIYRHRRVVFGVSASPFLLGATLSHLLTEVPEHMQETAKKLKESWYVDNCVTSVNDEKDLKKFIKQSVELLSSAKFDLRGWTYNKNLLPGQSTVDYSEDSEPASNQVESYRAENVPVLGLQWNLKTDTLSCDLRGLNDTESENITKRHILSTAHKIFDPIGFTSPVMLVPKLQLQECWKLKISWDADLPYEITQKFKKWKDQLHILKEVQIPRLLKEVHFSDGVCSLHVFCDASKVAYATCIFLRVEHGNRITCQLIQAKARVAPLREITIPRLELLACCIGARLADTVKQDLHVEHLPVMYWSDSTNVLHWIKSDEIWGTFVHNRVKEIRTLSHPEDWHSVPGQLNPADLPSRGCSAEMLLQTRWWEGPMWLKQRQEFWPRCEIFPDPEIIKAEKKKTIISASNNVQDNGNLFENISSYNKIVRVAAWILRFYKNARSKSRNVNISGELQVKELIQAERSVLKYVQRDFIREENEKRIRSLQTFVDNVGLFRVRTRITLRNDNEDFRHPILLPSKHSTVEKLILWKHQELNHAGVQVLMTTLRENYWILKSRKTIRQVINRCIKCKRFILRPVEASVAPLPEDRIRDAAIFEVTGVDLCGPLFLKDGDKAWIVLFTCAGFRACHLELVTSLSTDSFLQALRRFIARRGHPSTIYSDNGTNLVGARNELKRLDWKRVQEYATLKRIHWKLIPPAAPWWGGWWERLIGILKRLLRRVLGQTCLHYEELNTILCDAENIINSRPLTYLSEDTGDLVTLTPAMFLREIREAGVPDLDRIDKIQMNKRYSYRQKLRDDLRKRFRNEYLGQLRQQSKHVDNQTNIKEDDIVLIGSDNSKRMDWPLAKVIKTFLGKDGKVRLAKVRTQTGDYLRAIQRLYPLEISDREILVAKRLKSKAETLSIPIRGEGNEPLQLPVKTTRCGRIVRSPKRLNYS